ncbi:Vegetative incompatibility protein HET-E-1 [Colletotrichum sidae]|uniref:Vegetative incompatibility protein HET-E-1 n=1 Tax=Colletotrichum sidae TaxID=1347389 RepID=A0A4R8T4X3_9PEZI|nr:Vegetative incompatibility protein HET-E-1 [Colletotrichum sidae]
MDDLISKCQKLQSTLPPAVEAVRSIVAISNPQTASSRLLDEMMQIPDAAVALETNARECRQEQGLALMLMAQGIPDVCAETIRRVQVVFCATDSRNQQSQGAQERQAAALAVLVGVARRSLRLAGDALNFATCLGRAEQAGESPPYAASSILEDITAIQNVIRQNSTAEQVANNLQDLRLDETASSHAHIQQLHDMVISGFLNFLKTYIEHQSGTMTAEAARRGIAVGSAAPTYQPPHDNPLQRPQHAMANLLPAAPPVTFRHISKVVMTFEKEPQDIKFLPGGIPTFAVSTFHKDVALFRAATGERQHDIKVKGTHLVFSPVADVLALTVEHVEDPLKAKPIPLTHDFAHFDKPALYVLDTPRAAPGGAATKRFQMRWHGIRAFSFSPDGKLIAVKGVKHRVELVTSDKGAGHGVVRSHADEVTHAEFTSGGDRLVTMSRDGTLRVTRVESMRGVAKLDMEPWRNPLQLAVAPTGVVAAVWGRTVTIWDCETGAVGSYDVETARGREGWPLAVSPDLRWVASRTDGGADVTDLATGEVVYSATFESGFVSTAAFSGDGKYMVCGRCTNGHHGRTDSGILNIWEIQV